jgi:hypothetical protein
MEARMSRMEAMIEALVQDRGLVPPQGSIERDGSGSGPRRSMTVFSNPALDPVLAQMQHQVPEHAHAPTEDDVSTIRYGNRELPFPGIGQYQQYMSAFFDDIHLRHPCVNEAEFNARTQKIVTDGIASTSDVYHLASSYIIFACCDSLLDVAPLDTIGNKPSGWHWFQLADSVTHDEPSLSSGSNLDLIRFRLFEVGLYETYTIWPSLT